MKTAEYTCPWFFCEISVQLNFFMLNFHIELSATERKFHENTITILFRLVFMLLILKRYLFEILHTTLFVCAQKYI